LIEWSALNLTGWVIGFILVIIFADNLESIKHLAWKYGLASDFRKEWIGEAALVSLPFGLSVSVLQWVRLRQLRVNPLLWILATAIGYGVFVTLYSWVVKFDSFEYRMKYDVPYWIINVGLFIIMPIGGAIIGGLQSIVIKDKVSNLGLWIKAYIFGLTLPFATGYLAFAFKAVFLNTLYYFGLYDLAFGPAKYILLYSFLLLMSSIGISLFTGKALSNRLSLNAGQNAG